MKYISKIFSIFFISIYFSFFLLSYGNCKEDKIKLFYEIYYGPFKVGESEINITSQKYTAIVYSVGLARWIFPFYAKWETWVDENGYPKKAVIYSRERNKERKRLIYFQEKENKIIYQKLLPKREEPESVSLEFPIYDELSSFIASFYINYSIHSEVKMPLFIKKNRNFVKILFKEKTSCEFEKEKKECLYIETYLPKKSELLKRASKVEIFLLENKKIPIKLKGKLPIFGSLVGKLEKIETF